MLFWWKRYKHWISACIFIYITVPLLHPRIIRRTRSIMVTCSCFAGSCSHCAFRLWDAFALMLLVSFMWFVSVRISWKQARDYGWNASQRGNSQSVLGGKIVDRPNAKEDDLYGCGILCGCAVIHAPCFVVSSLCTRANVGAFLPLIVYDTWFNDITVVR